MGGSGWKLYLVCELESGSGQLFEFNQKKQTQSGLSYLRTRKLHGTRQSRLRPSSRVSRTWEEVPTLSNQVHPYSTFLTDKGRAPARSGVACPKNVQRQYFTCPSEFWDPSPETQWRKSRCTKAAKDTKTGQESVGPAILSALPRKGPRETCEVTKGDRDVGWEAHVTSRDPTLGAVGTHSRARPAWHVQ